MGASNDRIAMIAPRHKRWLWPLLLIASYYITPAALLFMALLYVRREFFPWGIYAAGAVVLKVVVVASTVAFLQSAADPTAAGALVFLLPIELSGIMERELMIRSGTWREGFEGEIPLLVLMLSAVGWLAVRTRGAHVILHERGFRSMTRRGALELMSQLSWRLDFLPDRATLEERYGATLSDAELLRRHVVDCRKGEITLGGTS
ncbi:MAG: hypothetical protein SF028_00260 [Candidatus Sumerlaeia bacterium]|nr:hypothetical protein [Candidatus Sumerlaeia bacterium]